MIPSEPHRIQPPAAQSERATRPPEGSVITVYGADWCEDTRRSRRHLRRLAIRHDYRNVDESPGVLERAKALNDGKRRTPTISMGDETLVEPSNEALTAALARQQWLTDEEARERMALQNVGDFERALRSGAGLLALALLPALPRRISRRPILVTGLSLLLTGLVGWCPLYAVSRRSSIGGPGDRRDEAERRSWTVALP